MDLPGQMRSFASCEEVGEVGSHETDVASASDQHVGDEHAKVADEEVPHSIFGLLVALNDRQREIVEEVPGTKNASEGAVVCVEHSQYSLWLRPVHLLSFLVGAKVELGVGEGFDRTHNDIDSQHEEEDYSVG